MAFGSTGKGRFPAFFPLLFRTNLPLFYFLFSLALRGAEVPYPPGYYDRTFGLSGDALRTVLHGLIRDHTVQPYTWAFQFDAWDALRVLDRDPVEPDRVILVFSGDSAPGSDTNGGGNPNPTAESWEREHLWPRSYGIGAEGPDFSDLFNLRPINPAVNQTRGNRIFDDPNPFHPLDPAVPAPGAPEVFFDPAGGQERIWAPRPVEKGSIARAMFYMATRYDGRDEQTVNLTLGDDPDTVTGHFGRRSALLAWHRSNPVSGEELRRNRIIFEEYQGNRNPFVDKPALADRVYAGAPPPPGLNLMLNRCVLALDDGPAALAGLVTLSQPSPGSVEVDLSVSGLFPGMVVPDTVTVSPGQTTAVFTIDATAAGPPPFQIFRREWTLSATAADYGSDAASATLLGGGGRGWETFDRLLIYGNAYRDGSFTGQNGVRWHYTHATGAGDFAIDGRGIIFRSMGEGSRIISEPIPGGINRLAIDLRKAFGGGGERRVEVLVNGVPRGSSPTFGNAPGVSAQVVSFNLDNLQVAGDFVLEIRHATGVSDYRQLVVDNIRWTGWPNRSLPPPSLEAFPDRLEMPSSPAESGPGEETRLRVFGTNLQTGLLRAEAPEDFEIATDGGSFASSLDLPEAVAGMAGVFLRVRLREGLPSGPRQGALTVTGGGAAPLEISLTGTVREPLGASAPGLTAQGYRQNFASLAETGNLPFGWAVTANGSASNRLNLSLWGTTETGIKRGGTVDPLLGYQHTANTGKAVFRLWLENLSGRTIRALDIAYLGRTARPGEPRPPEFRTLVNGALRPALGYGTFENDRIAKRERFGGLSISPGDRIEITWSSDRGIGSGASRQIGLTDVEIRVPEPPLISLLGPTLVILEQGAPFEDPGAVAEDGFDGGLPFTVSGMVNTGVAGDHPLTYQAVNSVGLEAEPVIRIVRVLRPYDYFAKVVHGLSGAAADPLSNPSGDGMPNLVKFALGGEPMDSPDGIMPSVAFDESGFPGLRFRNGPALIWEEAGSVLMGGGLRISLEVTEDLVHWSAPPAVLEGGHNGPMEPGSSLFLRIRDYNTNSRPLFLRLRIRLDDPH